MASRSNIGKLLYGLNAGRQAHFKTIKIQCNRITITLLEIFENIGVIRGFSVQDESNFILVYLKYNKFDMNIFLNIKQVSKSTKRIYVTLMHLLKIKEKRGAGILILSTNKGILIDSDCIKYKLGGEVLMRINI
jgi:small subunit ribosomal protein S8